MTSQLLSILHLEDDPLDAELIRETLNHAGIEAEIRQVDAEADFRAVLKSERIDLILADYSLPGFEGMAALAISQELCPNIPFIFISGTIGEEVVESLLRGATDYVLKQRPARLGVAIRRAVLQAEERQSRAAADEERRKAEVALRESNLRLKQAITDLQTRSEELASTTQQLMQASKLATMGELVASIAHELNNPLATLALRAESLGDQLEPNDPKLTAVQVILSEVDRMAKLVSNLLQISRRTHPQISTLDIREEVRSSLDFFGYYLLSHKIDVVLELASPLRSIQGDRQRLRQVFLNLLTNAADAMPEGGTLTIRAKVDRRKRGATVVVIEFTDTGIGIESSDFPKLWEPFFTTKPEGKGTGLGLPICRRTVEEHRGTIEIESNRNEGTTVRIILPAGDGS